MRHLTTLLLIPFLIMGKAGKVEYTSDSAFHAYQTINIKKGETKEIYFYLNLNGVLFYKIVNKSGSNRVKCWWIKGPFGAREDIGYLSNSGSTKFKGFFWGKLNGSADSDTKIIVSEYSDIFISSPSIHF